MDGSVAHPRLSRYPGLLPGDRDPAPAGRGRGQRPGTPRPRPRQLRIRSRAPRLARAHRPRRRRCRRRHRAERPPPRDRRGRGGRGQAHLVREAGRHRSRGDRRDRAGRSAGGRRDGLRLQLPLGAARPAHPPADRRRAARRADPLPRAVLLDVRARPARPALVALPPGGGRLRRPERPHVPRDRHGPVHVRADQPGRRGQGDLHQATASADARFGHALRTGQARRPDRAP